MNRESVNQSGDHSRTDSSFLPDRRTVKIPIGRAQAFEQRHRFMSHSRHDGQFVIDLQLLKMLGVGPV